MDIHLAGVFPFIGYWSKELIFDALWTGEQYLLFFVAFITAILTAFYSFRMVYLTFHGEKSEHLKSLEASGHHIHESPRTMTIPLVILAAFSLIGGLFELGFFEVFNGVSSQILDFGHLIPWQFGIATIFSLIIYSLGIGPAYWIYWKKGHDFSNLKLPD